MKRPSTVVMLFFFVATIHAQTADKEAMLQTAKAETESCYKGDSVRWVTFRVQSKDAWFTYASANGSNHIKGWDSIAKFLRPASNGKHCNI